MDAVLGSKVAAAKGRQDFYRTIFIAVAAIAAFDLISIILSLFGELTAYVITTIVIKSVIFLVLGIYCFYIFGFLSFRILLYEKGLRLMFLSKSITVPFSEITSAKIEKLPSGVKFITLERKSGPVVKISQKSLEKGQFKVVRLYLQEKGVLSTEAVETENK